MVRDGPAPAPALLGAQRRVSVISGQPDPALARTRAIVTHCVPVAGCGELGELLERLVASASPGDPKTLDLIGHSTAPDGLLQLGDWVIDAASPATTAWFRALADREVLPRLGVQAVRLLGCGTAETARGRDTMWVLADVLGLEVHGTTGAVLAANYDASGFKDEYRFLLLGSREVTRDRRDPAVATPPAFSCALPRVLELDALPSVTLDVHDDAWPRHVVCADAVPEILRLIRCDRGAAMPGLREQPSGELALPGSTPGTCRIVQLVLDGAFVRVHPDGAARPGLLYAVTDAATLRTLAARLPLARRCER